MSKTPPIVRQRRRCDMDESYGIAKFGFDVVMVVITGGLWLIWIFIREMRRKA